MKKLYCLLAFFLGSTLGLNAQIGSYTFSQTTSTYTPITGGTVYGDDSTGDELFVDPAVPLGGFADTGVGIPIGFNFTFNGVVFDRVAINANGWISFGQSTLSPAVTIENSYLDPLSTTTPISPAFLRSRIAAFGTDLEAQTNSELSVKTLGTSPSRTFVVQWKGYSVGWPGQDVNFQIRLEEGTNVVSIVYGTMTFGATNSSCRAEVGLGGASASEFNNRTTDINSNWNTTSGASSDDSCLFSPTVAPASGTTFTYTPPLPSPPSITYTPQQQVLYVGYPITVSPTNTGGAIITCGISPSLPAGLSFDISTGSISGTPTAVTGATNYTVTASNAEGSGTPFVISIETKKQPSPSITYPTPTNVYNLNEAITKLSPTTGDLMPIKVSTFAGTGFRGSDNGAGTDAAFYNPNGVAFDAADNMYVADAYNNAIRKITPAGVVSTFAGCATCGFSGGFTDGTVTAARFNGPTGIAVDASGKVYVADKFNNKIRIISNGMVSTLAGKTTTNGGSDDGAGSVATFNGPNGIAVDASGNVYVADFNNHKIRKITSSGDVSTLAGTGVAGSVDGAGSVATFNEPTGVAVDASGNVYVADSNNNKIRKITPAGVVSTFAGSIFGSLDGTGIAAKFAHPYGISVDASGNLYVVDNWGGKIRKITPGGVVTTLAGSDNSGAVDGTATEASFELPTGVALDSGGNVYVGDTDNHKIRKIANTNSFSITPSLPAGLSLDRTNGEITGTPTVATPATDYTVTATNYTVYTLADASASTFVISIQTGHLNLPIISYATPQVYNVNSAISPLSPTSTGGTVDSYAISPNLPAGLALNPTTGVISGTPTSAIAATNYTVTATNAAGIATATVNITINAISFTLSKDNFTVEIKGESCVNTNNGSIKITAKATHTYQATVNGTSHNFVGNVLTLSNLAPATYNIAISIAGQSYLQKFTAVIPKSPSVTGRSSLLDGRLDVDIDKGTAPYTISINGEEQFDTSSTSFSLAVKPGDVMEVKSAKACEGVYTKSINEALGNLLACFPNPTYGSFEIAIPDATQTTANIEMFTMGGQLLAKGTYPIKDKKVQLSLDGKPKGMYIVKIYMDNMEYGLKIIKN